jgi:hypothetical protein
VVWRWLKTSPAAAKHFFENIYTLTQEQKIMKNTLFSITNWIAVNPRRALLVLMVIMLVLSLTVAAVPGGVVLAEDIPGGS